MAVTAEMAKQKKDAGPKAETPGDALTSVKCYERMRKKIAQLGSLLDANQQDVLARYERHLDEDLLRELAKRQSELRQSRPG